MNFLGDIMRTVLGQYEDNYNQNQVESTDLEDYDSTILRHDDKNLQCEKQIIQCQITNDRLLGSTSKSLRKKYGNDVVNRAIQRLGKRRIRGKCSRKAVLMELEKKFRPVIETYFNKKKDSEYGNAL